MQISARINYACRALIELSLNWPNKTPIQINIIANRQNIPIKFLTHILINLKHLGYVSSTRGQNGGYLLAKPPREIVLSDVLRNLDGPDSAIIQDQTKSAHVLDTIWQEIDRLVIKKMSEVTFETICNKIRSQDQTIMFNI